MAQGDSSAWMHLRVLFLFFGVSRSLQRPPFLCGESPQTAGESRDPSRTRRKKIPLAASASKPFARSISVRMWVLQVQRRLYAFFSQYGFFFSQWWRPMLARFAGGFLAETWKTLTWNLADSREFEARWPSIHTLDFFFFVFFSLQERRNLWVTTLEMTAAEVEQP